MYLLDTFEVNNGFNKGDLILIVSIGSFFFQLFVKMNT